jgi:ABC-type protease/lipase transport system fused ATPase/permease subunit
MHDSLSPGINYTSLPQNVQLCRCTIECNLCALNRSVEDIEYRWA